MHGSFLCASLEIGMLRRALMYACELQQAQPRAPARLHAPSGATDGQGSPLRQQTSTDEYSLASPTPAPVDSSASAAGSAQAAAAPAVVKPRVRRNLTVQVFLHCARIDVSAPILMYKLYCTFSTAAVSVSCLLAPRCMGISCMVQTSISEQIGHQPAKISAHFATVCARCNHIMTTALPSSTLLQGG